MTNTISVRSHVTNDVPTLTSPSTADARGALRRAVRLTKAVVVTLVVALLVALGSKGVVEPHPDRADAAVSPAEQSSPAVQSAGVAEDAALPAEEVSAADLGGLELVGFDPWRGLRYSWGKTVNFVGCIFGVGVPIGVAWGLATNPYFWRYVLGMGQLPTSAVVTIGRSGAAIASWVKKRCVTAIR